jgi:hypothetical protein
MGRKTNLVYARVKIRHKLKMARIRREAQWD